MITIESVFSKKNLKKAFHHLERKKGGKDCMPFKELKIYWEHNKTLILEKIKNKNYHPETVRKYEIVNGKGKRRAVTKLADIDRLITRLLAQKLDNFYSPRFLGNSYAYQSDKGILSAVLRARDYIEAGNEVVVEIDIKDFFDEISLKRMLSILKEEIKDCCVIELLRNYFYCDISNDGEVIKKSKGLVQGSSMSPVLSNIYLHNLDMIMDELQYKWIRFADNIYIYVDSIESGIHIFKDMCARIKNEFYVPVNEQKSGIFSIYERRLLGYDFYKKQGKVQVKKHVYQRKENYRKWHPCVVQKINREYHIIQNGTLNKKDYALLFENDKEKHHIPVEATEQLNIYNEIILTSSVLNTLNSENIKLGLYNRHGDLIGFFIPEKYNPDSKVLLAQCKEYLNDKNRLNMAKKMEISAIHNIRANARYYNKHKPGELDGLIQILSDNIKSINECCDINELLLIEGRCRQSYYQGFNTIISQSGFNFERRTKRPPRDPINALISFGNTLLYNRIQQIIWRTSLDSRIGIFHSANKRHYSLNLDFADLFKPIIVDRIIFTLINRRQLGSDDFVINQDNSVYLNERGKKIFVEAFYGKLDSKLTVGRSVCSYHQLIENEIREYKKHLLEGTKYKPYKYY